MGDVIEFRSSKRPAPHELQNSCASFVLDRWNAAKAKNSLREFFVRTAVGADPEKGYLEDLNDLAWLEIKAGISPQIVALKFFDDTNEGWIVGFKINGVNFCTPFMESEIYARAFAVLLYQKLKRELE